MCMQGGLINNAIAVFYKATRKQSRSRLCHGESTMDWNGTTTKKCTGLCPLQVTRLEYLQENQVQLHSAYDEFIVGDKVIQCKQEN